MFLDGNMSLMTIMNDFNMSFTTSPTNKPKKERKKETDYTLLWGGGEWDLRHFNSVPKGSEQQVLINTNMTELSTLHMENLSSHSSQLLLILDSWIPKQ